MISVCMATYNGEKYIKDQLLSILQQLGLNDEIIIIDDKSNDKTLDIITSLNDSRIKTFINEKNKGPNATFEKAIYLSRGDIIYLSDQDDIWVNGRMKMMKDKLEKEKTSLVSSKFDCFDNNGNRVKEYENILESERSNTYLRNFIDIFLGMPNYFGCTMVFTKRLKKIILPIPTFVESHDLWIAMAANILRSNSHIEEITLHRRIHGNNTSLIKRNIYKKIKSRFIFLISIFLLLKRIYFSKQNTGVSRGLEQFENEYSAE
jgi:glycosyltransferase involved in cell wall biosynthesis